MADTRLINLDDGVKRVGGNKALYLKLLNKYIDGGYYEKLDSYIKSGDLTNAVSETHTLKGVAANLSLTAISETAAELEQALKNNLEYSAIFEVLETAHTETLDEINRLKNN